MNWYYRQGEREVTIATRSGFPGGQDVLTELGKQLNASQNEEVERLADEWHHAKSHP